MNTPLRLTALVLAAALGLGASAAQAKDWTEVKVGIEGAFPPWNSTTADGKMVGLDVDLIGDLCERAKIKCDIVSGDWASMIPGVQAGKFDLIMTVGINETRRKAIDFTVPYAAGVATFMVVKGGDVGAMPMNGERLNLNDKAKADPVMDKIHTLLKGKTVGVVQSTSQEQLIRAYFGKDVEVRTYRNSAERDLDLKAGRIDAGFDSGVYAMATFGKPGNEDLAMTGPQMRGAMLATDVAIGLRKGEPELKDRFDAAIRSAAEAGVIRTLSLKWSKLDLTPNFAE